MVHGIFVSRQLLEPAPNHYEPQQINKQHPGHPKQSTQGRLLDNDDHSRAACPCVAAISAECPVQRPVQPGGLCYFGAGAAGDEHAGVLWPHGRRRMGFAPPLKNPQGLARRPLPCVDVPLDRLRGIGLIFAYLIEGGCQPEFFTQLPNSCP